MLNLSKSLTDKSVSLLSTTIPSPTGRKNDDGEVMNCTIYFDKPVTKDGKQVPGKKSTLYTAHEGEATKLKATQDSCESVMLDGAGKYQPTNDLHYRFLKDSLTPSDMKEIKSLKGLLKANGQVIKVKSVLKGFTSAYIMGLPKEQRAIIADALATLTMPVVDALKNVASNDEEDEPLFS